MPPQNMRCGRNICHNPNSSPSRHQGGKKIALRGGDGTESHLPNQLPPPPPWSPCREGGWAGAALPAVPWGRVDPNKHGSKKHVTLIILITHMWGNFCREKTFLGQNLCSGAFGGNIRRYTKQRGRHGSPFLEPPPLLRRAPMPSPPPAKQFSGCPSAGRLCAPVRRCGEPQSGRSGARTMDGI